MIIGGYRRLLELNNQLFPKIFKWIFAIVYGSVVCLICACLLSTGASILFPEYVDVYPSSQSTNISTFIGIAVWVISMFSIISTLAVKTNNYMTTNFNIADLYKMGVILHIALVFITSIYFYSPVLMVWLESALGIIEVAIFSAFSIVLNTYLTDIIDLTYVFNIFFMSQAMLFQGPLKE